MWSPFTATASSDSEHSDDARIRYIPAAVVVVMFAAIVAAVQLLRGPAAPAAPQPAVVLVASDTADGGDKRQTLPSDALFDDDRAELKPGAEQPIRAFAAQVKQRADLRIVVIGHTDPRGSVAHNDKLSLARADAVRAVLVDDGIEPGRIAAVGLGARMLAKPRTACAGRADDADVVACLAPNRRVELWAKTLDTR